MDKVKEVLMEWIFSAFFGASVIHMAEEYFYPGGFLDLMRRFNPRFAPLVTIPMAIIINGLQLLLCVVAIALAQHALVFSMSIAGLIFINGLMHLATCIRLRGYAPGVVSAVLVYLPLSAYAYYIFIHSGQLTLGSVIATAVLGLLYQAVPISYFVLAGLKNRASA
jgi:hypothetical protein